MNENILESFNRLIWHDSKLSSLRTVNQDLDRTVIVFVDLFSALPSHPILWCTLAEFFPIKGQCGTEVRSATSDRADSGPDRRLAFLDPRSEKHAEAPGSDGSQYARRHGQGGADAANAFQPSRSHSK